MASALPRPKYVQDNESVTARCRRTGCNAELRAHAADAWYMQIGNKRVGETVACPKCGQPCQCFVSFPTEQAAKQAMDQLGIPPTATALPPGSGHVLITTARAKGKIRRSAF